MSEDIIDRLTRPGGRSGLGGRSRMFWCGIWLVFLGYPIDDVVSGHYSTTKAAFAWAGLAVFVVLYLRSLWVAFAASPGSSPGVDLRAYLALIALTLPLTVAFGAPWSGLVIYLGVATGASLAPRNGVVVLALLAVFSAVAGALGGHTLADIGFATFLEFALGISMIFFRRIVLLVVELRSAREEVARLAVAEERLRFSRDLHDVLGHGLSVIALKSQVARRLMASDPGAAAAALTDLDAVAHESLSAVREMVTGYRQPSLSEELAGAREVLGAAGIALDLEREPGMLPPQSDSLLAWAVREGVTNVLRHSHARRCRIDVDADAAAAAVRLEMADDGVGGSEQPGGSGLSGLRERMAAAGGTLEAGPAPGGGFRLRVELPLATA